MTFKYLAEAREAEIWKAIVDKSGRDYFYSPVLSQRSPNAFPASQMQVHPSRIDDDQSRTRFHMAKNNDRARKFDRSRIEIFGGREFFSDREFCISREFVLAVEKIFWSAGIFAPKCCHVVQTKMASSDGSSARDILRNIFGRMGDLNAAINQQQGSSFRRDTDLPPASLEDEVFNNHQVRPSNSTVPRTPA